MSFNFLDDLSSRVCVSNKTEDVNLNFAYNVTRINGLKTLTRHIHVTLNRNLIIENVIKFKITNNECKIHECQKNCIWKPCTCACEINRYLKSVADEIIVAVAT